ncbi:MAG: hypothetical protein ACUVRV_10525 [Cyanobacteriota bacterium]
MELVLGGGGAAPSFRADWLGLLCVLLAIWAMKFSDRLQHLDQ